MGPKPLKVAPANKASDLSVYKTGKHWVSEPDGEKPVIYSQTGIASEKGCPKRTLITLFDMAAKKAGDKIAMRTEDLNSLKKGERREESGGLDE